MSSPEKKRKTTATRNKKPKLTPNPSLPDDLLLNCFARVSRLYYPTLSLVSKHFRSLLASPELYKARSLLGHTENCLYVCLGFYTEHRWFTLCRKPNQTLTNDTIKKKNKSSGYVLATGPIPHSPPANDTGLVAVGSNIYNIGESNIYAERSSRVLILGCQSHTWHEGPSLPVELKTLSASVVDGKIYVAGCYKDGDSNFLKNSFEVFDTKTQIWDPNPIPCREIKGRFSDISACIDGKYHVLAGTKMVAYNPEEGRWDPVECNMWHYMTFVSSYCVIEKVLYSTSRKRENVQRSLRWYDTEVSMWRNLKGLVELPKFPDGVVTLADYGGKMAVVWNERLPYWGGPSVGFRSRVWCAVIALERRKSCEM